MIMSGQLIALLTFPGVIVHEIAHQLFCRWFRVAIFGVCYFQVGNPAGYVIHESARTFKQSFFISTGPFLVNTLVGALIAFPGVVPVLRFGGGSAIDVFLVWLGVSIAMHAFPSTEDANSLWSAAEDVHGGIFARVLVVPIVGLICLGAVGSVFWLDLVFGMAVCWAIPTAIVAALA